MILVRKREIYDTYLLKMTYFIIDTRRCLYNCCQCDFCFLMDCLIMYFCPKVIFIAIRSFCTGIFRDSNTEGHLRINSDCRSPQMLQLEKKLELELENDARVIACRFPFPHWTPAQVTGEGIDTVWVYDMSMFKGSEKRP